MNAFIKSSLLAVPGVRKLKARLLPDPDARHRETILATPMFVPNSDGAAPQIASLTHQAINSTFPALSRLADTIGGRDLPRITTADFGAGISSEHLKDLLDRYGSDKATTHSYHIAYARILQNRSVSAVLEIGLGTNNVDVVSHMTSAGRPGASLRAFRDYLPQARVYGADVDRRVLFDEDRINTHHVDQTDPDSFLQLGTKVPALFDLIIDDGLHSVDANLNTMVFALPRLRVDGWFVVEDARPSTADVWRVVASILPTTLDCYLIDDGTHVLFAVHRTR